MRRVTVAEYAGMPGHCHALVDQEPRRGKEASRWVLETTMGSVAPEQFLRLGPGQVGAKVLAPEEVGMRTQHPGAQVQCWVYRVLDDTVLSPKGQKDSPR